MEWPGNRVFAPSKRRWPQEMRRKRRRRRRRRRRRGRRRNDFPIYPCESFVIPKEWGEDEEEADEEGKISPFLHAKHGIVRKRRQRQEAVCSLLFARKRNFQTDLFARNIDFAPKTQPIFDFLKKTNSEGRGKTAEKSNFLPQNRGGLSQIFFFPFFAAFFGLFCHFFCHFFAIFCHFCRFLR